MIYQGNAITVTRRDTPNGNDVAMLTFDLKDESVNKLSSAVVELNINGGREQGYRAWSHKQNFPADPSGEWRVDIMTSSGQRLGLIRFKVSEDDELASQADGVIRASGLSGLNLRRFVPGRSNDDEAQASE